MIWTPEELRIFRSSSVMHLLDTQKITEDQTCLKDLFTCDLCTRVDDCEWAYHHDNLKGHCLMEEVDN